MRRELATLAMGLLALGAAGGALATSPPAGKARLFVYLQTAVTASALEKSLSAEMPGVEVTVFGRYADFERALEGQAPDAVLALKPVLTDRKLTAALTGTRSARESESYVVMSLDRALTRGELDTKVLGAVEMLGRSRMSTFVSTLLGTSKPAKIKPVIKQADLLPLLQFKVADAVLLPERAAREFQRSSNLSLAIADLGPIEVGLPCVAFLSDPSRAEMRAALERLNPATKQQIGVEAWK